MNAVVLLKYMDFMMSVLESMAIQLYGNFLQTYLIICHLLLWLAVRFSVLMEVYRQVLTVSIKLDTSIEFKRYLMKEQSVT